MTGPVSEPFLEIPFIRMLGIERGEGAGELRLAFRPEFANHLGQWAAGIEFSLAEAATGDFLARRFTSLAGRVVPVLRQARVRYRRSAQGSQLVTAVHAEVDALAEFEQALQRRRRAGIDIDVQVLDEGVCVLEAVFQWHVRMADNQGHD
ncbi:MAG: DUF4442 domain-containing protein [Gammaproteobacteria bacterium]|nr:MAG: DUF4442 domain-containing protein [Gammaproteobacteria bacterium]